MHRPAPQWHTATARLVGDVIEIDHEAPGEAYDPSDLPNLPNVFAKVDTAAAALRFIEKYGQLGIEERVRRPDGSMRLGERVYQILRQARAVDHVLHLLRALQHDRRDEVERLLVGWWEWPPDITLEWDIDLDVWWSPLDAGPPEDVARRRIVDLVNSNTRGIRTYLESTSGRIRLGTVAVSLIEWIWWHVGQAAVLLDQPDGGKGIESCKHCGMPFLVTHRAQEFCPPELWAKSSRCREAYRKRRRRGKEV